MAYARAKGLGLLMGRLVGAALLVGSGVTALGPGAWAETAQIGGWFVSDERLPDGTFSHCMMMEPYLNGERKVLLSVTLSKDKLAMLGVSDTEWTLKEGEKYSGKVAFDGSKPVPLTATNIAGIARLQIPQWSPFAAALRKAKVLAVKSSAGVVSFNLYDTSEAIRALESCVLVGHPPSIKRIVRDSEGNVIREETIPPVAEPMPDIVIKKK
ncbi:hypothetical protein [Rhodospirillum sp. A1_3_36]|uniref:hypothetical protein n=1 Tax=Rhodospirillum sp. A1_3_36 TaxID=3391666 RepID=UPI0039A746A0